MSFTRQNTDDVVTRFWSAIEGTRRENVERSEEAPVMMRDAAEPSGGGAWREGRRGFMQLLGAAVAVPSLAACTRQPPERIVPYVKAPEDVVPGRPLFYASTSLVGGVGTGTLVESHMGRPTKIEGNPEHPSSLGSSYTFAQAEILELYDPDRSQTVLHDGAIASWSAMLGALQAAMLTRKSVRGAGLRVLTGDVSSPTLIEQMRTLLRENPEARWHIHEPVGRRAVYAATNLLFGETLDVLVDLSRADVVLSLDSDFLDDSHPRIVREFADGRSRPAAEMLRLYMVESQVSITGSMADHRAPVKPSEVEHVARAIAAQLVPHDAAAILPQKTLPASIAQGTLDQVVADLKRAGKRAVVLAGRQQPQVVHMLAAAMNDALGSEAISYIDPILASGTENAGTLRELVAALEGGEVELLVVIGSNPVYAAPGDLDVAAAIRKAKLRVHVGLHFDETAALCHWHAPAAHPLEAWGDAKAHDGTVSLIQPLIEPLFGGRSPHEVIAALGDRPDKTGYEIVRDYWRDAFAGTDFERTWEDTLHDGLLPNSEKTRKRPAITKAAWSPPSTVAALEVCVRPDPCVHDGRFSNNAWMQELPKPLSKLTWDNAAFVSPATARELRVETGDMVELAAAGRKVIAPILVMPGTAAGVVVAHLGYGRERVGNVGNRIGFNAYALTSAAAPWHGPVEVSATDAEYEFGIAQPHPSMEGRDLVRYAHASEYEADREHWKKHEHQRLSLYPKHPYNGYAWGMSIDLSRCVGCNTCVTACQSENNIPVVGKEQVMVGREMHWLRIDRYFEGDEVNPRVLWQPLPCMHCENAPCEVVCPVAATVHHDEGLNDMVYNRCVGTKYCQNNCPYHVRRYNFFGYSHEKIAPMDPNAPTVQMSRNPDVTVRWYGVMEKCTYCVQRINYARVAAKREDRPIRDGEVMSACQAACPARAITFGDINDKQSEIAARKAEPRNYTILADLNTEPRTSYLARLTNENPAIGGTTAEKAGH
jgi:Fe-S-cluster-containing dehydrogenase component